MQRVVVHVFTGPLWTLNAKYKNGPRLITGIIKEPSVEVPNLATDQLLEIYLRLKYSRL